MNPSIFVTAPSVALPVPPPDSTHDTPDLLRELITLQREQLAALRGLNVGVADRARWRALYARHEQALPALPAQARQALPALERHYLTVLSELAEQLADADALDQEYAATELLDRYGPRLAQLGNLLGQLGQLSNIAE